MIKKQDLIELKKELDTNSSRNNDIIKIVIDELNKVDFEIVDSNKSSIKIKETSFELYLHSTSDNPFIYIYAENSIVEVQIGQGAQFLALTNLADESDIAKFEQVIKDLFHSSFHETLFYKGDNVITAKYCVCLDNCTRDYKFSVHFPIGLNKVFKKKKVTEQLLSAWITISK